MEVQGTFNAQRFFETLALIISQREGMKVTVTVTQPEPEKKSSQRERRAAAETKVFQKSIAVNSSKAVQIKIIPDTRRKATK